MSSNPNFACYFNASKTEEQKNEELNAYHEDVEKISRLPLENGWQTLPLRLYHGYWFPEAILPGVLSLCRNLHPIPSDTYLVTFPKSGTTWLKALAFAICCRNSEQTSSFKGHHPLLSRHPQDCSPYLEALFARRTVPDLSILPSPRQLSTHIPFSVLPKAIRDPSSPCRIVYLCREPKDTLISTYHFSSGVKTNKKPADTLTIEKAVELFCEGSSLYGPVWQHQLEYWQESQRRPDKVLFLKYEDMMAEPEANVRKLADFMGMPFSAEEERRGTVAEIVELCSFEMLSKLEVNKVGLWVNDGGIAINNSSFFRKGKVGDWREHLSVEMAKKVDAITKKKLHGTGLSHHGAEPGESAQVEKM